MGVNVHGFSGLPLHTNLCPCIHITKYNESSYIVMQQINFHSSHIVMPLHYPRKIVILWYIHIFVEKKMQNGPIHGCAITLIMCYIVNVHVLI